MRNKRELLDLQAEDGRPAPAASDVDPPAGPAVADTFPLLRAATGALSSPGDRFEYGLGVLIDGLQARLAGRPTTGQGTVSAG